MSMLDFQSERARSRVMIVDGYGVDIRVDSGHLVLRNGEFGSADSQVSRISRGRAELDRLLILSHDGVISLAALDWCHRMGVTVAIIDSGGGLVNCIVPGGIHDGPVKRAQAISGVTEDAIKLARWLLEQKFSSQIRTLDVQLQGLGVFGKRERERDHSVEEIRSCLFGLQSDRTLMALLSREGLAAQSYWRILSGLPLPWPEWTKSRIPSHWTRTWPRQTGAKALVRNANATLNMCYTFAEIETRIACAAYGLDTDFGVLHVDDRLRESFIYDLLEPLRSTVDALALEIILRRGLRPYMFHELREGVVRLDPDWSRDLARYVMPRLRTPALELAAAYAYRLRSIKVPYTLERPTRLHGPVEKTWDRVKDAGLRMCEYCKQPLPRRGLKFCNRLCYLRHSVEIRQPLKKAQARLAELRAIGISPGHGGEAAKKRGAKIARSNRLRALRP